METWKDIKDYEGRYKVSNYGNVKNSKSGYILKKSINSCGYEVVGLCGKTLKVHRLVALEFLVNPLGHKKVKHIDKCKTNNMVGNLVWFSVVKTPKKKRKKRSNYVSIPVKCVTTGEEFKSIKEACIKYNVSYYQIRNCVDNMRLYAGTYNGDPLKWSY